MFWIFRQLVSFKNSAAVYTLDVLSFVIFGDQPRFFVFAGGNLVHGSYLGEGLVPPNDDSTYAFVVRQPPQPVRRRKRGSRNPVTARAL